MGFVVLGVLLAALKLAGLGPVAGWPWWVVLLPFGLAVVWWALADHLGYTERAALRRQEDRVARRREANQRALGLRPGSRGRDDPPGP